MKRHSSARALTNLGRRLIIPAALLATLYGVPQPALAQEKPNGSNATQNDASKKAREQAEAHLKSSRAELKKQNFGAAREYLEKARAADAKTPGIDQLARDIAAAEQSAAEEKREEQVEKLLDGAKSLSRSGKYDEALVEVQKALSLNPTSRDAQKLRSEIEEDKTEAMEDALRETVRARIKAAEKATKENNFEAARRLEASAREAAKGLFKSDLDKLTERIAEAESKYNARRNADEIKRLQASANANLKANRFDQARQDVSRILELDRQNRNANRTLNRIGEAEKEFIAERQEREIAQQLQTADRLLKARQYEAAANAYQAVLDQDSGNRDATRGLASAKSAMAKESTEAEKSAAADARKKEAEAKAAEAKAAADARKAEEAKKADEAKAAAEARKADEARKAEEAKAAADARKADEARKAEEARAAAAAKKQEEERMAAEEKAAAEARKAEEERQRAEAAAAAPAPIPASTEEVPSPFDRSTPPPAEATPAPPAATPVPAEPTVAVPDPFARDAAPAQPEATPEAPQVDRAAERAAQRQAEEARRAEAAAQADRRRQAENAYEEGIALYRSGELARARQRWLDAKELDPTFVKPDSYLANTEREYNTLLANQAAAQKFEQDEAAAVERMNTLIPLRTLEPTPLSEFLQSLRLLSGIDFVIAGEVNAKIEAAFEDVPLVDVLDSTLLPIGLRWRREPGSNTVIVEPDLRTEVFHLTPDQIVVSQSLIEDGVFGRLLYGPAGTPVLQGQEVFTDPRRNVIVVTDSQSNLDKVRRLLESLEGQQRTQLIFDSYEIDESRAPEIKALLDAILSADDDQPFNTQRKLILEGSTLIIKDTPQNVQKVREILQDQNFLKRFYEDVLAVATFNLTPIIDFEDNPDLIRQFTDQVRQVVETLLYSQEGRSKAEAEGRRIWFDPATLQLTITDYPDRLATVQNYIESLPYIRTRRRSKIIFLDHATAGELVSQIESFLGINTAATTSTTGGESVTKSLSVQDELEFRGAFFRLTRVNENDAADEFDDSIELVIRTGTTSQTSTIEEFNSEFIEDFEVVADDIKPSNTPGEGRARITVRYVPNSTGGGTTIDGEQQEQEEEAEDDRERVREETGLSIVDIENLNAVFVEYDNVEELREVEFWVRTLDIPTLQVDIEMKFVEVITNKAKELKPDFIIGDLTESLTLSDSVLRGRFAQDRDEFGSPFEPGLESADAANLLKGATVFNFLVSNGNSPISFQLRVLEAQGIINIVNGPRVTVLNRETVDFRIEREFGLATPVEGATGGGNNDQFQLVASLVPVDLSITPTVTRAGNIRLDLDVDIRDFDQNLGQLVNLDGESVSPLLPDATVPVARVSTDVGILRKELTTQARIKDGGTIVLGGWRSERTSDLESGIPVLRDIPFVGPILFQRMQKDQDKITLLIFLTGNVVRD